MKHKKRIKIKKYILPAAIALCAVLCFALLIVGGLGNDAPSDHLEKLTFSGEYSADGTTFLPISGGIVDGEKQVTLRGNFNREFAQGKMIWLRLENIGVKVIINSKEVFSCYQEGEFPKIFKSPGYAWKSFYYPPTAQNDTVELKIISYYGNSASTVETLLNSIYSGDGSGFYQLILKEFGFVGFALFIALFAGILYLLEGTLNLTQKVGDGKRLVLIGFYCVAGSMLGLFDAMYPYFSFLFSHAWIGGVLDVLGVLLLPIALTMLVRLFMRSKKTKVAMTAAAASAILQTIVLLSLQLFGVCDLYEAQIVIAWIAAVQLICALVCIITEMTVNRSMNLLLLLLALLPVVISMTMDCFNLVFAFMPRRTTMKYALAASYAILLYQVVTYAKNEKAKADKICRIEKELTDSRISIMLGQIQPHFLYNALGTIRALCAIDSEKARTAIDKFSKYLRGNMDSLTETKPILFEKELEHLKNYLYIEKLRYGEKLKICYDIGTTNFVCPSLTIQPLVENAIKHGIMQRESGGTITISSFENETEFIIKIADDGMGFAASENIGESHIGIENTANRLKAMVNGVLAIQNLEHGTSVTVTIPKGGAE